MSYHSLHRLKRFSRLAPLFLALLLWAPGCSDDTPVGSSGTVGNKTGAKIVSGQAFDIKIDPARWREVKIAVLSTMTPFQTTDEFDSRVRVEQHTTARFVLGYNRADGEHVQREVMGTIDNVTHKIEANGAVVNTLADLFDASAVTNATGVISVCIYTDYVVRLEASPVLSAYAVAATLATSGSATPVQKDSAKPSTTDSGRTITTVKDGYPRCPDLDSAAECQELIRLGLKDSVTRTGGPTDTTNCWGWTFTCGKEWIATGDDVKKILEDNGYKQVTDPQPGDVIVYKDASGNITHSGIVRKDKDGKIKIESKWGRLGRYCHSPTAVPPSYGTPCYYRTDRPAPPGSMDPDKEKHTLKK